MCLFIYIIDNTYIYIYIYYVKKITLDAINHLTTLNVIIYFYFILFCFINGDFNYFYPGGAGPFRSYLGHCSYQSGTDACSNRVQGVRSQHSRLV